LRERRFGFAVVSLARVDAIAAEEPASCEVARHTAHGLLEDGTVLARLRAGGFEPTSLPWLRSLDGRGPSSSRVA